LTASEDKLTKMLEGLTALLELCVMLLLRASIQTLPLLSQSLVLGEKIVWILK